MKFGKTLQKLSEEDKQYGALYMQYKLLRKFLKQHTHASNTQTLFIQMLENESTRIKKIINIKRSELEVALESLMTSVHALSLSNDSDDEASAKVDKLTTHADDLANRMAGLDRFVYYNMEGFRKAIKKHDKLTGLSLSWEQTSLLRAFFMSSQHELEQTLLELSDIYRELKEKDPRSSLGGEHKVSDDTFERKSHKYWVAPEDAFQFKVKVIKHLPLHIFSRKIKRDSSKFVQDVLLHPKGDSKADDDWTNFGWISSVYMDNDKMDCYKTRVNMDESATLFRVRWYADSKDVLESGRRFIPRTPEIGLYYERKTHHESWVLAPSIKERFPITSEHVAPFMAGEYPPQDFLTTDKQVRLAAEFQEEIVKRKLHPVIRTAYKRTAFQHEDTNDVRITLDSNLSFANEDPKYLQPGQWKREEEELEGEDSLHLFPYAVLEVKLKAEEPEWLADILKQPFIRKVHKFSKFQQACALFYPYSIHMFPYWFQQEDIDRVKAELKEKLTTEEKNHAKDLESLKDMTATQISSDEASDVMDVADDVTVSIEAESESAGVDNRAFVDNETGREESGKEYKLSLANHVTEDCNRNNNGSVSIEMDTHPTKHHHDLPVIIPSNGSTNYGGIKTTEPVQNTAPRKSWKLWRKGKKKNSKDRIATSRVKIEPKTHFANERTMLQWLQFGMTLFWLGGIIFNLSREQAAVASGLMFMAVAMIIIIYAMARYYHRIKLIYQRKKRFDDRVGPVVLGILLLIALIINVVLVYKNRQISDEPAAMGAIG